MADIIIGIVFIPLGAWLAWYHAKKLANGESNYSGGLSNLIMIGIGMIIIGLIVIAKHLAS
jgi:uncharacterized membrane protein YidH (DUF202 family)